MFINRGVTNTWGEIHTLQHYGVLNRQPNSQQTIASGEGGGAKLGYQKSQKKVSKPYP